MELVNILKFCSKCKGDYKKENGRLFVCTNCGFKQYINPVPCNGVIIKNREDQIMLVKRKIEPKKGYWDLPGGFIEPGESFEESVKREIKEELNIEIEITKILGVYNDYYLYEGVKYPTLGIVVEAKMITDNIKAADDISSYKFFNKEEVLKQNLAFTSLRKSLNDYLS